MLLLFVSTCLLLLPSFITSFSLQVVRPPYSYDARYYEQKLDHFDFENPETFLQKYLISVEFWEPGEGAIFFYAGNEAAIEDFANNTGFMWDMAPEFKAIVVFAEHRYYGESVPKNTNSSSPHYYRYLNSVQVLADFADLLVEIKRTIKGSENAPVIAFGGSYGAMLATWMRIKYPHLVEGALAASAPLMYNESDCNYYNRIVTQDFERESSECSKSIRRSWGVIDQFDTPEGRIFLTETFRLCSPLNSTECVAEFKDFLSDVWGTVAMVDYPHANNFIKPIPAWPIKEMCRYLTNSSLEDHQLMEALFEAVSVYQNFTGTQTCNKFDDVEGDSIDMNAWVYQTCTEMVLPMCADGVTDMFEPEPWDFEKYKKKCNETFGVIPDPQFLVTTYGGVDLDGASNIIFSNGDLDPWSGGGILESLSDSVIAIRIADSAHHLDLRASEQDDPPSVVEARHNETVIIHDWIKDYYLRQSEI